MQSVNDDMDELYRKAAEDYPLKADGANWDKLLQQMQQEPHLSERGQQKSRFLWLLVLLPMFLICHRYTNHNSRTNAEALKADLKTEDKRTKGNDNTLMDSPFSNNADHPKTGKQENHSPIATESNRLQATVHKAPNQDFKLLTTEAYTTHQNISNTKWNKPKQASLVQNPDRHVTSDPENSHKKITADEATATTKDVEPQINKTISSTTPGIETTDSVTQKKDEAPKVIDTLQKPAPVLTKKKFKKTTQTGAYYGFVAGPDFSTVKMQKLEGVGYNFGMIAGYNLTNKLSVETGFLWNNKKYYSKGEYFDGKNIGWAPHTELIYISGSCNMFEIPVNLRYDWLQQTNYKLFITAGASSYLMNKESYDYLAKRYNLTYEGARVYHHSTKDWFSVLNLGAGYQRKLGTIATLRIEPYLKLPVTGIGIGNMSIASTGIYFGLTRTIQ